MSNEKLLIWLCTMFFIVGVVVGCAIGTGFTRNQAYENNAGYYEVDNGWGAVDWKWNGKPKE